MASKRTAHKNNYYRKSKKNGVKKHSKKHSKKHNKKHNKKHSKKHSKKIMRGGTSSNQYSRYPGDLKNETSMTAVNIGGKGVDSHFAESSYTKSDTPLLAKGYVNYIPQPLMDLKWSVGSNVKNFFNELFGQPKQLSSSPTDQPIGKINQPIIPPSLTTEDLNTMYNKIVANYSN